MGEVEKANTAGPTAPAEKCWCAVRYSEHNGQTRPLTLRRSTWVDQGKKNSDVWTIRVTAKTNAGLFSQDGASGGLEWEG